MIIDTETLSKLHPGQGDLIVCRLPEMTPPEGMKAASDLLVGLLAGTGAKVLLITDDASLEQLSAEDLQRVGMMRVPE